MIFNLNSLPLYKINFPYQFNDDEKKCIADLSLKHMPANNNYFSESEYILDNKKVENLKKSIQEIFTNFKSNVLGINQDLLITQSWLAKTVKGGWHSPHKHPNSMFSCVWYLQTPKNSSINFHYENEMFKYFNFEYDFCKTTEYNSNLYKLSVESMDLIIFPSQIVHSVDENLSDTDRIVLGINSFIFGNFGTNSTYPVKLSLQGH
jgi:uncharacterized protein (TIGR02466 family)